MAESRKLKIGSPAPDFEFTLTRGNAMALSQIAEKGPVLVNFLKGGWNAQYLNYIRNLRRWQSSLGKKNVTLVVISNDSIEVLREVSKAHTIDFLFGSIVDAKTFESFGIELQSGNDFTKPTTFLIETDMSVRLILDEQRMEQATAILATTNKTAA